jgi:hypothetical protein
VPPNRRGNSTFSTADNVGSSPKLWKTTPIAVRRRARRSSADKEIIGAPFQRTSPWSGRSRPESTPMNVVLPEPDGPINATKSLGFSERDAPRTASTPFAPV